LTTLGRGFHPLFLLVASTAGVLLFFRPLVASRFDLISGDAGDTRLQIAILEHWLNVFRGHDQFASPPFFAPEPHALGYSDAMFLFSLPYGAARAMGLDRYLAFESALMCVKAIGFLSMYGVLRVCLPGGERWIALLGAVLFTISNCYYLAAGHAQFYAVGLVPLLCLLGWRYRQARGRGNTRAALGWLAGVAVLLATLLFTSFYVGWFTIFVAGLGCSLWCAGTLLGRLRTRGAQAPHFKGSHALADMAFASFVLLVAMIPFLLVYVPVLMRTGGRSFQEVLLYAPQPSDVLNVGADNLVWGALQSRLIGAHDDRFIFARYELQRGWPPLTLLLFLATTALSLRATATARRDGHVRHQAAALTSLFGVTAMLGWLLTVRLSSVTPWLLVFRLVPGASAIRVPVRMNLVLNLLVIVVNMLGLSALKTTNNGRWRAASVVLALILVAEQLNRANTFRLSRSAEAAIFERIEVAPPNCRYFYVLEPNPTHDPFDAIATQTEAMLIAADRRVPTINGYSGGYPPGWDLLFLDADYAERVARWVSAKGIASGVCSLDVSSGRWSMIPEDAHRQDHSGARTTAPTRLSVATGSRTRYLVHG
jgi:hypothetical protein